MVVNSLGVEDGTESELDDGISSKACDMMITEDR